jgi:hypothetical protein
LQGWKRAGINIIPKLVGRQHLPHHKRDTETQITPTENTMSAAKQL